MNNKLIISIEIPSIEKKYDLFIPINKKIGTIKKCIVSSIVDLSNGILEEKQYSLIDIDTGKIYQNDVCVKDSGIKNGARIMIV